MTLFSLLRASLRHYRATHAVVVVGVAVAVTVLAGALLVGASVRESLRELALGRLGTTDLVLSSTTFFREALAREMESFHAVPVVALSGTIVHEDSGRTATRVQVFGIDGRFSRFQGLQDVAPTGAEAWLGHALARELDAAPGDSLLLRLARPTDIPLGTLQGRRESIGERVRLTATRILDRASLGEFSVVPKQGPALVVFVSLDRLQRDLDLDERVNALLARSDLDPASALRQLEAAAQNAFTLQDLGLSFRAAPGRAGVILESASGLLTDAVVEGAMRATRDLGLASQAVLTYLATTIRIGERAIPYSLVSAIDFDTNDAEASALQQTLPPIWLNEWAAEDLEARPGDTVTLEYFLWSDEQGLRSDSRPFVLRGIVPMTGLGGDRTLTPNYPGITDADDVTEWDPPFPIDLKRVRRHDERYWDDWRTTPKALVRLSDGQRLWSSRFGSVSSVRIRTGDVATTQLAEGLRRHLDPLKSGLSVRHARAEALAAAKGTTDFGEYFAYFSVFLVVAGLLLASLFFALGVEQRARELGVLGAIGFTPALVWRLLLGEASVLAIAGSVLGLAGAVAYASLIMYGLRTWWVEAVGTTALELHIDPLLLIAGMALAFVSALAALGVSFRRLATPTPRALLAGSLSHNEGVTSRPSWPRPVALLALAMAAVMVALASAGVLNQVVGFFGAGGLLMAAGLAAFRWWLHGSAGSPTAGHVVRLGVDYARWRPSRSVLSTAFIAFACFVLVSVGAFKRDPAGTSLAPQSSTGGFVLMLESVGPLMHNPNSQVGREELGLTPNLLPVDLRVARFRLRPGDEASCLTLYRPSNPRIIAPEEAFLSEGRFSFAASLASSPEEHKNPWLLLKRRFDDGAIPAVVDQTSLSYVFHLKVGDDFVFSPDGSSNVRLRIVGALADSVLQSELIIGESAFVQLFPRHEGYRLWMIEAPASEAAALATLLEDRLADFGVDTVETRTRLAAYHQVENTYLSTFQALGGLGLLVGTLGLAAVLARNVLERRRELGLLAAVGFTPAHLRTLVLAEGGLLVGTGVALGTFAALVAVAPALGTRAGTVPFSSLALLLAAVVATALVASLLATRVAMATPVVQAMKNE